MEKLLNSTQKQLISFEKIPENNIFETAIFTNYASYAEKLIDILSITDREIRIKRLMLFIENNYNNICIGVLHNVTNDIYFNDGNGTLYNFAYPLNQFIKD